MTDTFLKARIERLKTRIEKYEDAIDALVDGQLVQYTIDTGQSRQVVIVQDVPRLEKTLQGMYATLHSLEARLNGASTRVSPAW